MARRSRFLRLVLPFLLVMIAHGSPRAFADIVQCDGVWTNRPCEEQRRSALKEKPFTPPDKKKTQLDQKRLAFNAFDLERTRLQRKYDFYHDPGAAREICLDDTSALRECREAIEASSRTLQEKVSVALASHREEKPTAKPADSEQNVVAVTQSEETIIVVPPERRKHHRPEWGPAETPTSIPRPPVSRPPGVRPTQRPGRGAL